MIGVGLCILSAIPVFVLGVLDEDGMLAIYGIVFCLIIISAGVFFLVRTCVIFGSFQKLLEEGDYTRDKKMAEKTYNGMAAHMDHLALCGSPVRRGARHKRSGT